MKKLDAAQTTRAPRAAIPENVRDWAANLGLPDIWQLGIAVADVPGAMRDFEAAGCPAFLDLHGKPSKWNERGQAKKVRGRLALSHVGGMEIELLGPEAGTRFYSEHFDPGGRPVLHHVGILTHDLSLWLDRLQKEGHQLAVHGVISVGAYRVEFLYVDTREELGLYTELIDYRILGRPAGPMPRAVTALGGVQRRVLR